MSEYRQREKGLSNLVKLLIFGIFLGIFILPVSAAQLGMNYYHESMMNSGGHYITRSAGEASTDLDNINKITPDVKFYMNPYISGNEAWVLQLTSIAKQKGMHVVVVMNVDDRQLSNDSWGDYSNLVVNTAKDFSGKADEFVVGNEISLHGIDRSDVGNLVEPLISSVKSVFNGDVSYEAFWYEKDSLKGYSGKLYFNMYETLDNFKANVNEMNTDFGSNANIGEFGVDMNSVNNNESAQIAQQVAFVPQNFNEILVHAYSFRENLQFAQMSHYPSLSGLPESKLLPSLIEKYGIDYDIPVSQLSGGQRQILSILMVLARSPKILLLDEPTAALDEENTQLVMDFLQDLCMYQGLTIIAIVHSQELVEKYTPRGYFELVSHHGQREIHFVSLMK